jgi:hypothetical protein
MCLYFGFNYKVPRLQYAEGWGTSKIFWKSEYPEKTYPTALNVCLYLRISVAMIVGRYNYVTQYVRAHLSFLLSEILSEKWFILDNILDTKHSFVTLAVLNAFPNTVNLDSDLYIRYRSAAHVLSSTSNVHSLIIHKLIGKYVTCSGW